MIVGLEGVHTQGSLTLNDRLADLPRHELTNTPGLFQLPEFEPIQDPTIGRLGEVPRRGDRGGKSFTFEGITKAASIIDLREAQADLVSHFATTSERRWEMAGHAEDPNVAELAERWYYARAIDVVGGDEWPDAARLRTDTHGFEAVFSIVLRMSDPRFYFPDAETVTSTTQATNGGSGQIATPEGEDEGDASDQAITVAAPNDGNIDTPAVITVEANAGQIVNPVVSNETLGKFLRFTNLTLDASEGIVIDTKNQTVERLNGDNSRHKLDGLSTWWDLGIQQLAPGANSIRLRGFTLGAGASLTVDWYSADIA